MARVCDNPSGGFCSAACSHDGAAPCHLLARLGRSRCDLQAVPITHLSTCELREVKIGRRRDWLSLSYTRRLTEIGCYLFSHLLKPLQHLWRAGHNDSLWTALAASPEQDHHHKTEAARQCDIGRRQSPVIGDSAKRRLTDRRDNCEGEGLHREHRRPDVV